jgi:hypothetical protein
VAGGAVLASVLVPGRSVATLLAHGTVFGGVTAAAFAMVYWHSLQGQFSHHEEGMVTYWAESFPPSDPPAFLLWFVRTHTGNLMAYPFGGKNFASILTTVAALAGLVTLVRRKSWLWLAMIVAPFALTLVAAFFHRYPYGGSARVSQHLAPAIALLTGVGICTWIGLAGARQKQLCLLALAGLVVLAVGGTVRDIWRPYKIKGVFDARAATNAWIGAVSPGDQIVNLSPPEQWDPCLNWLFVPLRARFHGPGWPGDGGGPSGTIWVLNADPHVNPVKIAQSRWPQATVVEQRSGDFSLNPPNPQQHFEWVRLKVADD